MNIYMGYKVKDQIASLNILCFTSLATIPTLCYDVPQISCLELCCLGAQDFQALMLLIRNEYLCNINQCACSCLLKKAKDLSAIQLILLTHKLLANMNIGLLFSSYVRPAQVSKGSNVICNNGIWNYVTCLVLLQLLVGHFFLVS